MGGIYYFGGLRGPPRPPFLRFQGFWGPLQTPSKKNSSTFQHFIDLCGLSAFQHAFTFCFTLKLSEYMMFLVKLGFFVDFWPIFSRFYIVKSVPDKCHGSNLVSILKRQKKGEFCIYSLTYISSNIKLFYFPEKVSFL